MSKALLKVALKHPEKIASPIAKSLVAAAGSGLGAAGAFKLLSALRPELAEAALWGGTTAGGVLGHDLAGMLARKKIAYARKKRAAMVKEAPRKKEYPLTKRANLSRAAKGAIALPLGVMGAAAIAPGHLFGDIGNLISGGAGKLADPTVGQKITEVLAGTGSRMAFNPHMNTDVAMLLGTAGLSGLGAGAGKLSERLIPIAKAPIARAASPAVAAASGISAKKKAAIIAALLASGGGGYLLGKNNSDS